MLPVGISVSVGPFGSWAMGQRASEQWKWNSYNKAGRAWVLLVRAGWRWSCCWWSCCWYWSWSWRAVRCATLRVRMRVYFELVLRTLNVYILLQETLLLFLRLLLLQSGVAWLIPVSGAFLAYRFSSSANPLLLQRMYVVDKQTFRIAFSKNVQFFISTNQTCP
jgi:hypothetical protein